MKAMLIGYGEDAHRLEEGRRLVLGGVEIASDRGAVAHSDGDALLHALADAVLSAVGGGDIGEIFPDSDPRWAGLAGADLLERVLELAGAHPLRCERPRCGRLRQVRAVVILDRPKLAPYREAMRRRLAELCGLEPADVNVAFKTSEGLAPYHVQARVVVEIEPAG